MKKIESELPFNYRTIKVTQSRINKGLLAVPVSLIDYFPKHKAEIYVATGTSHQTYPKNFTPYTSRSRECRIGGMRSFYDKFNVRDGDELIVQFLDANKYRILTETQFNNTVRKIEDEFDKSATESEASSKLNQLSKITNMKLDEILWSEYYRLSKMRAKQRKQGIIKQSKTKEGVPASIRKLLGDIYGGKCQISGFGFLMKNGKPYFDMHHIRSNLGDHVKNLLVVSPNVHAQFTHAFVKEHFDNDGWLRRVMFNEKEFSVNHVIDKIPRRFTKEVHCEASF